VTIENEPAPSMVQKLRKRFSEAENHLKGKGTSEEEDPHPELAYTRPTPQETTPGFFSKLKSSFGGNKKDSTKGKDGSDVPSEVSYPTHNQLIFLCLHFLSLRVMCRLHFLEYYVTVLFCFQLLMV
jgi:hypothetical protein